MASTRVRYDPGFEAYIAMRRLRTELWRSLPPLVFIRWMFNKHPRMVIPFALTLGLVANGVTAWEIWL